VDGIVRDKAWGILLFLLSLLAMAGYLWWLFLAPEWPILGRSLRDWAVIIPVMLIVYLFLFILLWIGWAMATTPPPLPTVKRPEEEREEPEKEG